MRNIIYNVEIFTDLDDESGREIINICQRHEIGEKSLVKISLDQLDLLIEHLREAQEILLKEVL